MRRNLRDGSTVGRPNFRGEAKRGAARDRSSKKWYEHISYPDNWEEISLAVKQRDGFTCQKSGCHRYCPPPFHNRLHAHHLTSGKNRSHKMKDLITVCASCHADEHAHMSRNRK